MKKLIFPGRYVALCLLVCAILGNDAHILLVKFWLVRAGFTPLLHVRTAKMNTLRITALPTGIERISVRVAFGS